MKTLHLTLTKKWFDIILSGEKTEEYREIKKHWNRILYECLDPSPYRAHGECYIFTKTIDNPSDCPCHACDISEIKHFDLIEFCNGYSKDAPTMLVECKGITTGIGNPLWGAPSHQVFIIKLGKVIETKNLKS